MIVIGTDVCSLLDLPEQDCWSGLYVLPIKSHLPGPAGEAILIIAFCVCNVHGLCLGGAGRVVGLI